MVADEGDLLPQHVGKHLHDLHDQGLLSVGGGFINIPFSEAPEIIVEGLQSGLLGGKTSLLVGVFRTQFARS